ncbi:MAG TPA: SPFH domain-containing protein [Phycisphaerales bacterium]|nr:SPFH domain-containing protein [Phycisphaerales bacterium]HMP38377.1 SPFH domain-containing protein [Phycisphaerales bacterium]
MKKLLPIVVGTLLLIVLVLYNVTYTVRFNEVAIRTRFGKAEGVERREGLHLKMPFFVDRVTKLDNRLQLVDSTMQTVQTRDGEQVIVQCYLLWRLAEDDQGVRDFFTSFGSIEKANLDLGRMLLSSIPVIGGFEFQELIGPGNRLVAAEARVLEDLRRTLPAGVDAVGVGVTQLVLPPKTSQAVMRRMRATQQRLAQTERSRGEAEAELIQSEAATKADKIRAFAEARSAEIEAEGNRAAATYFEQMRANQDLAIFLSWLDTFRASLGGNTTVFLDAAQAPMHLIDLSSPVGPDGIPRPRRDAASPMPMPRGADPAPPRGGGAPARPAPAAAADSGDDR